MELSYSEITLPCELSKGKQEEKSKGKNNPKHCKCVLLKE